MSQDVALPGTIEFQANIRYFENGHMRRFETPLWAHSFMSAMLNAEKLLLSHHPAAAMMSIELVHLERKKHSVPRLAFVNTEAPPPARPPKPA